MRAGKRLHAFAASARVPNLTSVVTNVAAGALLATAQPAIAPLIAATMCGGLLCVAGNVGNDWADRKWDAVHRPERALPRGLFHPAFYGVIVFFCVTAALGFAAYYPQILPWILVLLGTIGVYTWLHKRHPIAVVPMGLCRGFLPVIGACAVAQTVPWEVMWHASALFLYVIGLSLFARGEARNETGGKGMSAFCFAAPIWALIAVAQQKEISGAAIFMVMLVLLLIFRAVWGPKRSMGARVSGLLAAMPLLDGVVLVEIAADPHGAVDWFFLLLPFVAFLVSRFLQKYISAT